MIQDEDKKIISELFQTKLSHQVRLVMFTQHKSPLVLMVGHKCEWCEQTEQLLTEIGKLSDKITVELYDFVKDAEKAESYKIDKIPGFAIIGEKDYGVRYFGIPAGYEFTTLIEDIIDVSNGATSLSDKTKENLAQITEDVHLQVFVTPTCPYCTKAVRTAHQMAIVNDHIRADMVEATEFPYLANRFKVAGVPKIVINETDSFEGAVPELVFSMFILRALGKLPDDLKAKLKRYEL